MTTWTRRWLMMVTAIAWLIVAWYGYRSTKVDDSDGWGQRYAVFTIALIVGAVVIVGAAASVSQHGGRPRLRMAGLVVCGLGVAATIVAWALPLWMTVLGVGLALVSVASEPRWRLAVAGLAAGQVVGLVALIAGTAAEVGESDKYDTYPAAAGLALMVTAAATIVAIVALTRRPTSEREHRADAAAGAQVVEAFVDLT